MSVSSVYNSRSGVKIKFTHCQISAPRESASRSRENTVANIGIMLYSRAQCSLSVRSKNNTSFPKEKKKQKKTKTFSPPSASSLAIGREKILINISVRERNYTHTLCALCSSFVISFFPSSAKKQNTHAISQRAALWLPFFPRSSVRVRVRRLCFFTDPPLPLSLSCMRHANVIHHNVHP